jgi:D-lactate dehydrogenase
LLDIKTNNMAYKIAFFGAKPYDIASFDKVNEKYNYDIRYYKGHLNPNNVVLTQDTDVVCIFVNDTADAAVIDAMVDNGVKLLALRCAGFNNVDLKAAKGKLPVVRVPAYSPYAVAEYSLALMLSLNRKIHRAYWRTRDGNFSLNGLMGFDMHGKTIGIIGTGKIAKILIRLLKGFGMRILAYDLYPDMKFAGEEGISYVSLDELYRESDIISLHCPLTDQTKYMIDKDSIDKMKEGVMIINTGRGQLINTNDLIEGLKEKKIAAAGLDVYEEEGEYFYEDKSDKIIDDDVLARLLSFNNVIVTSHQAFFTKEALHNIAETTLQNIEDFRCHRPLVNEVIL